ncbi:hypothetical protein AGLY_001238 [Aphis glycines]|uniref:Uncharacterized protein n=1 Tax=Aphis glycines TaxID=307491 RepID=A0A6G0U986_APHGL|nr:hypothetical protein AGLY_001238 [Aphis glycines]
MYKGPIKFDHQVHTFIVNSVLIFSDKSIDCPNDPNIFIEPTSPHIRQSFRILSLDDDIYKFNNFIIIHFSIMTDSQKSTFYGVNILGSQYKYRQIFRTFTNAGCLSYMIYQTLFVKVRTTKRVVNLSAIGYNFQWLPVGIKGGLCFNGLNTPKFKFFYKMIDINRYRYAISYKNLLEGKLSVEFFNLRYKHKQFNDFSTTKLLANFRDFDIFQQLLRNLLSINNSKKVNFENLTVDSFLSYNYLYKKIDLIEDWFTIEISV